MPTLEDVERLARQAGQILRSGYPERPGVQREMVVEHKSAIDLVTEYDYRAEAYLLEEISTRFPDDRIVSEESGETNGGSQNGAGESGGVWLIDPLDGTVNYAHGVPFFCVSLAYRFAGQTRLGVVYDPLRDECFTAERGAGACLNGRPLAVAGAVELGDALLVTGFPYDIRTNPENNLDHYMHFALSSQGVRRLGSAALDLCYLAAGRFDGYWEIRLNAWDVAAGALIAREAGAKVTNCYGDPDFLRPPVSVVAANETLHARILQNLDRSAS